MELTQESLEQAILKLSTMTDDRGILMRPPSKLVVPEYFGKAVADLIPLNHEIEVDFSND